MRRFQLKRTLDPVGVSGTGTVAEGVEFTDGTVTMRWLTSYKSTVLWESMQEVHAVHCHGGHSVVEWIDKDEKISYATVLDVQSGVTNTLPTNEVTRVTYSHDGGIYSLRWLDKWGAPPTVGRRIEIEMDDIMQPKHARIFSERHTQDDNL